MMTHENAKQILGKRDSKKLQHATYLRRTRQYQMEGGLPVKAECFALGVDYIDAIDIVYHDTAIVTILDNGMWILRNGGYFTKTTKERLNDFSPARIDGPTARNMGEAHDSPFRPGLYSRDPFHGGPWMVGSIEWEEGIIVDSVGRSIDHLTEVK